MATASAQPPGAPDEECRLPASTAAARAACKLVRELDGVKKPAFVVSHALESDREAERPDELALLLAQLVAGALGDGTQVHQTPAPRATGLRLARDQRLVFIEPRMAAGRLAVTANVYEGKRTFWERLLQTDPVPIAHAYAEVGADAELRSFYPRPPLVVSQVHKVPLPDPTALALACGDVGDDGTTEVVVLGRHRAQLGRFRKDSFSNEARLQVAALSPVASSPLRQAIGNIVVHAAGYVDLGLTDRQHGVRWAPSAGTDDAEVHDAETVPLAAGRIPWGELGCLRSKSIELSGPIQPCLPNAPDPKRPREPLGGGAVDAIAASSFGATQALAWREANTTHVTMEDHMGQRAELENGGAQLAIGDLDGDAKPELLISSPSLDPKRDRLTVYTLDKGRLTSRFELPAPGGIRAIAVCPWQGAGIAPVAMAVGRQLWLLR